MAVTELVLSPVGKYRALNTTGSLPDKAEYYPQGWSDAGRTLARVSVSIVEEGFQEKEIGARPAQRRWPVRREETGRRREQDGGEVADYRVICAVRQPALSRVRSRQPRHNVRTPGKPSRRRARWPPSRPIQRMAWRTVGTGVPGVGRWPSK